MKLRTLILVLIISVAQSQAQPNTRSVISPAQKTTVPVIKKNIPPTAPQQDLKTQLTLFFRDCKGWFKNELDKKGKYYDYITSPCRNNGQNHDSALQLYYIRFRSYVKSALANQDIYNKYFGSFDLNDTYIYDQLNKDDYIGGKTFYYEVEQIIQNLCNEFSKPEEPPVKYSIKVSAGNDQTIRLPLNSVTLRGEIQSDLKIAAVSWYGVPGNGRFTITNEKQRVTTIEDLQAGEYEFIFEAFDTEKNFDEDRVKIIVLPEEVTRPPTVDAGPDLTIQLPANFVQLQGSVFSENKIGLIRWSGSPQNGKASIESPGTLSTLVTGLEQGVYEFTLEVFDSKRKSGKDGVRITVLPEPYKNQPPHVDAGPDQTIDLSNTRRITMNGKAEDPEGQLQSVNWSVFQGSGSAQIINPDSKQPVIVFRNAGNYIFKFEAWDRDNASAWDTVRITVGREIIIHHPPKVDAGPDTTILLPFNSILLQGDTSSDSRIVRMRWSKLQGPDTYKFENNDSSSLNAKVVDLEEGSYLFQLFAEDKFQQSGRDVVRITVKKTDTDGTDSANNFWIIIIILIIIAAAATSSWFLFPVWFPKKTQKLIAYFMNENEKQIIQKLMPNAEIVDSYSMGRADKRTIRKLGEAGLALLLLNTTELVIKTPGYVRKYKFSLKKNKYVMDSEEKSMRAVPGNFSNTLPDGMPVINSGYPSYQIITLDGPLLPAYKKKLHDAGIEILQKIPENSYVICLENENQQQLINDKVRFDFIRMINPYTPNDTGFILKNVPGMSAADKITVDLNLHRAEDHDLVEKMLTKEKIQIIDTFRNFIRIVIPNRSNIREWLASIKYVQAIYEHVRPVLHNDLARQTIGITDDRQQNFIDETGKDEIIAVADTGIDDMHDDLKSRIMGKSAWGRKAGNDSSDPHGHGTHVTGTIVGDGTSSGGQIKGMAPDAKVFFQSIMDENSELIDLKLQLHDLFLEAYNKGARIHNDSWGAPTGSRYTYNSAVVDLFMVEYPEMLIVLAAGNEGVCSPGSGYIDRDSLVSPATAKNAITVGASRSKRMKGGYADSTYGVVYSQRYTLPPTSTEKISGDPESMAPFSSRGPCSDDRIKPDIVAPGTDILSTKSSLAPLSQFDGGYNIDQYAFMSGTSMATPIISGLAAIVRQYFRERRNNNKPSAALIKATLINGTRKLKGESANYKTQFLPNYNQGFGIADILTTIPNNQNKFRLEYRDSLQDESLNFMDTGEERTFKLRISRPAWIRICMAYTDPGIDTTRNDLDLIVDKEGKKWCGNSEINSRPDDPRLQKDKKNNVEHIVLENAEPGEYFIRIHVTNMPDYPGVNKTRQGFGLVVTTSDLNCQFENA